MEYSSKGHKFSYSLELWMIFSKIMSAFAVFGKIATVEMHKIALRIPFWGGNVTNFDNRVVF